MITVSFGKGSILAIAFLFYTETLFGSSFLTIGAEAKNNAGAGILNVQNSSSMFYNPANLAPSSNVQLDTELSVLSVNYTYTYPDYEPTNVQLVTPLYSLGVSAPLGRYVSAAFSGVVIPESGGAMTIEGLATRELSVEPVVVDVESKGNGIGYQLGSSLAVRPTNFLSLGLSFITEKAGSNSIVTDPESKAVLMEKLTSSQTMRILCGATLQLFANRWRIGAVYKPAASQKNSTKEKTIASTGDWVTTDKSGKEYSLIGLASKIKIAKVSGFIEVQREDHTVEAHNTSRERELYVATSYAAGMSYEHSQRGPHFGIAGGYYPTHIGNGIMAEFAEDGAALDGMNFEDIQGGMSRIVAAASYAQRFGKHALSAGASYHSASRSVPEYSKGYGDYSMQVVFVSLGWDYKFGTLRSNRGIIAKSSSEN